jgi:hypothetical protein
VQSRVDLAGRSDMKGLPGMDSAVYAKDRNAERF